MLSRRRFAGCALCAAGGALMAEVGAHAQTPGMNRTVVNRTEYPGQNMVTVQMLVDIEPNFLVARHIHPGVESATVLQGGGLFRMKGAADRTVAAGDSLQVPYATPHLLQNGPAKTRIMSVYVVEKDKPIAIPAPE